MTQDIKNNKIYKIHLKIQRISIKDLDIKYKKIMNMKQK